ncbi:AAA family ATPase [uncultured Devosia sp.]|uniref:AAA family ATPase n=1 Tax=uncultured Devosia sp. TaxID=211434 RepID=UPI0026055270|nr:AAA family ATPase [uncultured Devosia sp.]
MSAVHPLRSLGQRIVILGPSNAGKSTLAAALGRKLGIEVIHLDQLHHQPNTNWVPRPREEFVTLQRLAMQGDAWVMDGNYSGLFEERLARATGAIVLDDGHWQRTGRYLRRTMFERQRIGNLEGNKDSLKWSMLHWVFVASRPNGARYRQIIKSSGLPYVFCRSLRQVRELYVAWDLSRPRRDH